MFNSENTNVFFNFHIGSYPQGWTAIKTTNRLDKSDTECFSELTFLWLLNEIISIHKNWLSLPLRMPLRRLRESVVRLDLPFLEFRSFLCPFHASHSNKNVSSWVTSQSLLSQQIPTRRLWKYLIGPWTLCLTHWLVSMWFVQLLNSSIRNQGTYVPNFPLHMTGYTQ